MIGLILGDTKLGNLIIKKLSFAKISFIIIDISKKKIYKKNKNSFSLSIGQLGKAISILKKNNCKKIIFAGKVSRPNFSKKLLDRLFVNFRKFADMRELESTAHYLKSFFRRFASVF